MLKQLKNNYRRNNLLVTVHVTLNFIGTDNKTVKGLGNYMGLGQSFFQKYTVRNILSPKVFFASWSYIPVLLMYHYLYKSADNSTFEYNDLQRNFQK